ncbi:MAG: cache domain-containing protein [Deltaproteobacteria bacterium]|nr:cache domain-containing protein [Deltaproteobacteria bacterium]
MKKALMSVLAAVILFLPAGAWSGASGNLSARDVLIKSEVETAVSMLQGIADMQAQGKMALEEAKRLGAHLLRNLSYGKEGYFWADTTDGVNVVLYGRKDTEGRNRIEDKDAAGVYYVKAFLARAAAGGGYVEYLFTKKGQTEPQAKRSYVLPFKPFGWVVGTGYYVAEVTDAEAARPAADLSKAVARLEAGMVNVLQGLRASMAETARETGRIGGHRETEIRQMLKKNVDAGRPYVIDAAFIDNRGIMKLIEPGRYKMHEGSDISKQEAVIKMMKTKKPLMGHYFLSVEGIKSVDMEYPVFSKGNRFIGSVSLLIKPDDMIHTVAAPVEKDLHVNCWVMQKDGVILYETDAKQMGLNLFTDPLYKDYPELIALGRNMIKKQQGNGFYTFLVHDGKKVIKKQAFWKTIHFLNNDLIIVAYREVK